jgi:hypothetical protein
MVKKRSCPLKCHAPLTVCVTGYTRYINVDPKPGSNEYKRLMRKAGIF